MPQKRTFCEFGQKVQIRLVELNKTNAWLIEQVAQDSGKYFDLSYLYKIKTGQTAPAALMASICKILNLPRPQA